MQTAVEFLQQALSIHLTFGQQMQFEGLFQQAKEMEKDQICWAYFNGQHKDKKDIPSKYYYETYEIKTNNK